MHNASKDAKEVGSSLKCEPKASTKPCADCAVSAGSGGAGAISLCWGFLGEDGCDAATSEAARILSANLAGDVTGGWLVTVSSSAMTGEGMIAGAWTTVLGNRVNGAQAGEGATAKGDGGGSI